MTIGVFADYLDYKNRFIAVTAVDDNVAAAELKKQIQRLGATNVSKPYRYVMDEEGGGTYEPL